MGNGTIFTKPPNTNFTKDLLNPFNLIIELNSNNNNNKGNFLTNKFLYSQHLSKKYKIVIILEGFWIAVCCCVLCNHPHKAIINHFDVLRQYPIFKTLKKYELILKYSCWRTICLRSLVPGFFFNFLFFFFLFLHQHHMKKRKTNRFPCCIKNGCENLQRKRVPNRP